MKGLQGKKPGVCIYRAAGMPTSPKLLSQSSRVVANARNLHELSVEVCCATLANSDDAQEWQAFRLAKDGQIARIASDGQPRIQNIFKDVGCCLLYLHCDTMTWVQLLAFIFKSHNVRKAGTPHLLQHLPLHVNVGVTKPPGSSNVIPGDHCSTLARMAMTPAPDCCPHACMQHAVRCISFTGRSTAPRRV
jgi:hypothetical protein